MGPETLQDLAATFGVPGALLIYMYLNRKKDEPGDSPVRELLTQVQEMNARLIRVETILEERK